MFRVLQERPESLNVVLGALWSVPEAILGVFERLGRLQAAFGAPRSTLVGLRQLFGASRRSIPTLRKPNGAPRQRNQASREPIVALRKLKTKLSPSYQAWSRSRRRRGRRPHEMLGVVWNSQIIYRRR